MDKKILLSGAAAIVLGASLFAAPANAAFDFSIGGKSSVTLTMSDECLAQATQLEGQGTITEDSVTDAVTGGLAIAQLLGLTYDADDDLNAGGTAAEDEDEIETALNALMGGAIVTADEDNDMVADITFAADPCTDPKDNPTLGISNEASWTASTTLANGLSVSVGDDLDLANGGSMTLSGAFGSLEIKKAVDSAVKASFVGDDADIAVVGQGNLGGHTLGTSGTAGTSVLWSAPSMGGVDIKLSYAPNADDDGETEASYMDTIGVGIGVQLDALAVSLGWESADAKDDSCHVAAGVFDTADADGNSVNLGAASVSAAHVYNTVYGTDYCGDETNMVIGAALNAGGLDIKAGYSVFDTAEADKTTMNVRLDTTMDAYSLNLQWADSVKSSKVGSKDTKQTVLAGGVSTALGDGVNMSLALSNNTYDDPSQALGNGKQTDYRAQFKIEATF